MVQNGFSLRYVIRENIYPNYDGEDNQYFEQVSINCAPLSGLIYKADDHKLHQFIHIFSRGIPLISGSNQGKINNMGGLKSKPFRPTTEAKAKNLYGSKKRRY